MKVYRDQNGVLLNIGEWDLLPYEVEDENGITVVDGNPIPDGTVISDEEVTTGLDGGLYVVGDPRAVAY